MAKYLGVELDKGEHHLLAVAREAVVRDDGRGQDRSFWRARGETEARPILSPRPRESTVNRRCRRAADCAAAGSMVESEAGGQHPMEP